MKKKVVVLGCGMVGATLARDLARDEDLDVTITDINSENLDRVRDVENLRPQREDLSAGDRLRATIEPFDLVVGAMPSRLGFQILRTVIECGKPFADISFMAEDADALDALAKERDVTAVVDCGVAPGLANLIVGACVHSLDRTERVVYYVGGLPWRRIWPYQYKAPFAPSDVLEEYTRPVRLIEKGRLVVKPALSEPELIDFPEVGTLEAFNTDGLRSLVRTVRADHMVEKTLRYPGHRDLMLALRETGFLGRQTIAVGSARVRPLDVTSALLFPKWTLEPGEREFTVLRVVVEGTSGSRRLRHEYNLFDEYDSETGETSMARTTGFPCAIVARMLARGEFRQPGVLAPEALGCETGVLEKMSAELSARGIHLIGKTEELDAGSGPDPSIADGPSIPAP